MSMNIAPVLIEGVIFLLHPSDPPTFESDQFKMISCYNLLLLVFDEYYRFKPIVVDEHL